MRSIFVRLTAFVDLKKISKFNLTPKMLLLGIYVLCRALRGDRGPPFLRFLQNDRLINGNLRQGLIQNTFSNPIYIVNEFSFYTRNR